MANAKEGREILEAIFLDPPKSYIVKILRKELPHQVYHVHCSTIPIMVFGSRTCNLRAVMMEVMRQRWLPDQDVSGRIVPIVLGMVGGIIQDYPNLNYFTCPSKSAFAPCHRPLRMAPKLFAVAKIRPRILASVVRGRLCLYFATQPCLAFSLYNTIKTSVFPSSPP